MGSSWAERGVIEGDFQKKNFIQWSFLFERNEFMASKENS